ncbi:hypothetical protein HDZ31DRAFT_41371 [Schizophyllum fasciatum]
MLLEPAGVRDSSDGGQAVVVCSECLDGLLGSDDNPPKFSLANDLWIGRVPWAIQQLTVTEQLLLSLVYTRVFVFKLRPKIGGAPDAETNQRAMRGNVCSYEQDMNGIAAMVEGDLLPRPITILPAVLSVTYVGPGPLPRGWLYNTFKVRRSVLRQAFLCLQQTDAKYFGRIALSEERLAALPEDDVPEELAACIMHNDDVGAIEEEHGNYAPQDDVDGIGGCASELHF